MLYSFEDFTLDTARRELRRSGEMIALQPQVFDLLEYSIRNRERVVSKDDLLAAVWQGLPTHRNPAVKRGLMSPIERFGRTVGLAAKVSSCDPVEFLAARRTDNQIGLPRDDLLDGRYSAEEPMVCATLC